MDSTNKNSTLALTGFIISIIALVLSPVPIVNNFAGLLAVLSLVFGLVAMRVTKKGKKSGRGKAKATIVLSVIAFAVVLGSQALYGSVLDEAGKELEKSGSQFTESMDKASGDQTQELLSKDVDVAFGKFQATTNQIGLVNAKLPVTATNKNAEAKSYHIKIEAIGTDGSRIMDDTVYVDKLGPGQSQQFESFSYSDPGKTEALKTATFKVLSVSQL